MYLHQVIESVQTWDEYYASKPKLEQMRPWLIEQLYKAHSFHFGSFLDIASLFPVDDWIKEKAVAFMRFPDHTKLPYPICWFDRLHGHNSGIKIGTLVLDAKKMKWGDLDGRLLDDIENDVFMFLSFTRMDEYRRKQWELDPLIVFVCSGGYFPKGIMKNKLDHTNVMSAVFSDDPWFKTKEGEESNAGMLSDRLSYVELCLLMLHTKNITTHKIRAPHKLNKARLKKNKPPTFDYYILKIKVPGKTNIYLTVGKSDKENRYHWCRGHLRFYTVEKPLFGKYPGLFWIPAHARGSKQKGMVFKDYEVEAVNER